MGRCRTSAQASMTSSSTRWSRNASLSSAPRRLRLISRPLIPPSCPTGSARSSGSGCTMHSHRLEARIEPRRRWPCHAPCWRPSAMPNPACSGRENSLADPLRRLAAVERLAPTDQPMRIGRPLTPLRDTVLMTNARDQPRVGSEIEAEIASADRIDLVLASSTTLPARSRAPNGLNLPAQPAGNERTGRLTVLVPPPTVANLPIHPALKISCYHHLRRVSGTQRSAVSWSGARRKSCPRCRVSVRILAGP